MNSSRRQTPAERLHGEQPPPPAVLRAGLAYTRFIPREELQGFAAWTPGAFSEQPSLVQPAQPGAPHAAVRARAQGEAAPSARTPAWPVGDLFSDAPSAPPPAAAAAPAPAPAPEMAQDMAAALAAQRAELLADLQQQLAAARQQGYQDGYRDGLVALDSFKESFATQTSSQMARVLQALDDDLGRMEQAMAGSVARVATELARQVVRSELAVRPALVAQVAREAVNAVLMSARHITVLVHPDDHALVAQGCEEALVARGARLLAQPAVARGGCRVESDAGVIDAQVATRWAMATQALGGGVQWDDGAADGEATGGDA
ncbi:MAG: flagellar assembly protein FliH [Pseudomonadota bacterium]